MRVRADYSLELKRDVTASKRTDLKKPQSSTEWNCSEERTKGRKNFHWNTGKHTRVVNATKLMKRWEHGICATARGELEHTTRVWIKEAKAIC